MVVKELFAKLGFKVDDKGLKQFEQGLAGAKASVLGLGTLVAAGAASIFGLAYSTATAASEVNKLSIRSGIGREALQGLMTAAEASGIESDQLGLSLQFLNRHMYEARQGSGTAAKAFSQFGGNVAALVKAGRPANEVFEAIADRMQNIQDPAKRTALAMEIFGRSGGQLIPFLSKGSGYIQHMSEEAKELGLILSDETIEASKKFKIELTMLGHVAHGTKNIIGAGLIQSITPLLHRFNEWYIATAKIRNQNLIGFMKSLMEVIKKTGAFLFNLAGGFNVLLKPFGGLLKILSAVIAGFAVFKSMQLIVALGTMAQGLYKAAAGFTFMGNASLVAQAKAIALPLLIGAAIVGLLLLLEDFAVYLQGGDSFIGVLFQKVPEALNFLKEAFGPIFTPLIALFEGITSGTLSWMDALKLVGTVILNSILFPFRMVASAFSNITGLIGRLTGSDLMKGISDDMGGLTSMLAVNPDTSPLPGKAFAPTQNNQVMQNITNNFGSDENASNIATKVADSSGSALDDILRSSSRNLTPGVAY